MKMLIIEDDILYVGILQRYLEGLTDEIIVAKNWEVAEQFLSVADIMWIDLVVPPHNEKFAIIKIGEIRKANERVVIFVVSGIPDESIGREVIAAGADFFAEKMDMTNQNQVIALMIQALMKAEERGKDAMKFLQRARQLISERVTPQT